MDGIHMRAGPVALEIIELASCTKEAKATEKKPTTWFDERKKRRRMQQIRDKALPSPLVRAGF